MNKRKIISIKTMSSYLIYSFPDDKKVNGCNAQQCLWVSSTAILTRWEWNKWRELLIYLPIGRRKSFLWDMKHQFSWNMRCLFHSLSAGRLRLCFMSSDLSWLLSGLENFAMGLGNVLRIVTWDFFPTLHSCLYGKCSLWFTLSWVKTICSINQTTF
jgi:hypothetical protein